MLISLLFAAAFVADEPVASAQPQAQPVAQKKICRVDLDTGSIVPKRVCRTQAEWDEIEAEARRFVDKLSSAHQTR